MAIRVPWDRYEVAYLLDLCLKVEAGTLKRSEAVAKGSQHLRQRAIYRGIDIDEVFRNENGINMQLAAIRNCYHGKDGGLTISKLFREVVEIYKTSPTEYEKILQEESINMQAPSVWQSFLIFLKENSSEKAVNETVSSLSMLGVFCAKKRVFSTPIKEITTIEEIETLQGIMKKPTPLGLQSKKTIACMIKSLYLFHSFLSSRKDDTKPEQKDMTNDQCNPENQSIENLDVMYVDFSENRSYAHTKPISCIYNGRAIKCHGWNALFISVVRLIYRDFKDTFPIGKQLLTSGNRIDTGSADSMIYPKEIADGVYLECNVSATGVVNKIRAIMDACGIPYNKIIISFRKTGDIVSTDLQIKKKPSIWVPMYSEQVSRILIDHYAFGFRLGSPIEVMRFRNYAETDELSLPSSDEELIKEINATGIEIDGKLFVISQDTYDELRARLTTIFSEGAKIVFLQPFYDQNFDWFEEHYISSVEMLKKIIKHFSDDFYCSNNIVSVVGKITEQEAIVSELCRVWPDQPVAQFDELQASLKYIPSEKLAYQLSISASFVWVSKGKYFNMAYFVISEEDRNHISEFVSYECDERGYVSITELPLSSIHEVNYELTENALYSAIYESVLKSDYFLNGKILTREANGVDIDKLLKAFCSDREECTIDQVMERSFEITGAHNRQHSFSALYDTLIRIDSETFVSEQQIQFDVEAIDSILNGIIGKRFIPIKGITTFSLFPTCGKPWTHYLLESFCYRYSKNFRLHVMNYNDKNAGIISHKSLSLSYIDMLSEAAAKASIDLTLESVGTYFFEEGYTAKAKYSSLPEIIEKATAIREER